MKNYQEQFVKNQRRDFLKFIGKAGVSLPLLQASALGAGMMLTRQAEAAGVAQRKVVFIYVPDGTPEGASKSYLPDAGMVLKECAVPLESVKNECVFFKDMGIDGGGGHGNSQRVLGAFAPANLTIDLALEGSIGATSPIASLRLGVRTGGVEPISSRGFTVVTDIQDNPRAVFERMFGNVVNTSGPGIAREKRILDVSQQSLNRLKAKLGSYELERLEQHTAAINKLKNDIDAAAGGSGLAACASPLFNTDARQTVQLDEHFTDLFSLQVENLVLALKCNITRVGVIQLGTHQAEFMVNKGWPGKTGDYHGSIHSGDYNFCKTYRTYFTERVAQLIQRLKETDDPAGGKLLDNTLVVQVTDMGDGNAHSDSDAPFMLAGGGAAIQRGKMVDVGGAKHYQLLETVSEYMGVRGTIGTYSAAGPLGGILS